jgi:phage-related protein
MPPQQRKKKVVEPQAPVVTPEGGVENVVAPVVETVTEALALAAENISNTQADITDMLTDEVGAITVQVAIAKDSAVSLVTEQVAVVTEQVLEQVTAVTEQVTAVTEQVTAVTEQVTAVTEQVTAAAEQAKTAAQDAVKTVTDMADSLSKTAAKTLADLIAEAVNSKKYMKVVLSKNASNMLLSIVSSSPAALDNIKHSLMEVISDGKIDSNDIPHFISIIQNLYEIVNSIKEFHFDTQAKATICAEVLKFISHFLILDEQIPVAEPMRDIFINQIDCLIDSCVSLLSFQAAISIKGCCLPFCR